MCYLRGLGTFQRRLLLLICYLPVCYSLHLNVPAPELASQGRLARFISTLMFFNGREQQSPVRGLFAPLPPPPAAFSVNTFHRPHTLTRNTNIENDTAVSTRGLAPEWLPLEWRNRSASMAPDLPIKWSHSRHLVKLTTQIPVWPKGSGARYCCCSRRRFQGAMIQPTHEDGPLIGRAHGAGVSGIAPCPASQMQHQLLRRPGWLISSANPDPEWGLKALLHRPALKDRASNLVAWAAA